MKSSTENLRHTKWECKYHVVFILKCRRKVMYRSIRKELGPIMGELAQQKESEVEERHLMGDPVHMMLTIPPKYSVSGGRGGGYIKGKSAIAIARRFMDRKKNFVGLNFWARGYHVSTAGRDKRQVRQNIREQENEDRRLDQLKMFE